MRQYITQVKAKGATPIVCSLIPRNRWNGEKVNRNTDDYALWAKQAAEQEKVLFIPLNDLVADQYDKLGKEKVQAELFPPNEAVHPNWAGAKLNAETVVGAIKGLQDCPLSGLFAGECEKAFETPDIKAPAYGELGPTGKPPKIPAFGSGGQRVCCSSHCAQVKSTKAAWRWINRCSAMNLGRYGRPGPTQPS